MASIKGRLDDAAVEELNVIAKEEGRLTPPAIVEQARSKKSSLHRYFEWNDSKAAEAFRLEQARFMIREVSFVVVHNGQEFETRRFVSVESADNGRAYYPIEDVAADPLLREQYMKALNQTLATAQNHLVALIALDAKLRERKRKPRKAKASAVSASK